MIEEEQISESYNADDKEQVNKARKRAKREELLRKEVVRGIMSIQEGRAWLYDYLSNCGTFTSPFHPNENQTNFNCGMQHIGHLIQEDIMRAAPESYWKMIKEAEKNEKDQ